MTFIAGLEQTFPENMSVYIYIYTPSGSTSPAAAGGGFDVLFGERQSQKKRNPVCRRMNSAKHGKTTCFAEKGHG